MLTALTTFLSNLFRSREIELLRKEAVRLREEVEWLRSSLAQYKGYHADQNKTIQGYQSENTKLKNIIKELNQLKKVA
jgi:uncharacterized protein YlxW (UPF0749 family)